MIAARDDDTPPTLLTLILRPQRGDGWPPWPQRFRAALKLLLRRCGLRAEAFLEHRRLTDDTKEGHGD
jgi:hypothetical protein